MQDTTVVRDLAAVWDSTAPNPSTNSQLTAQAQQTPHRKPRPQQQLPFSPDTVIAFGPRGKPAAHRSPRRQQQQQQMRRGNEASAQRGAAVLAMQRTVSRESFEAHGESSTADSRSKGGGDGWEVHDVKDSRAQSARRTLQHQHARVGAHVHQAQGPTTGRPSPVIAQRQRGGRLVLLRRTSGGKVLESEHHGTVV